MTRLINLKPNTDFILSRQKEVSCFSSLSDISIFRLKHTHSVFLRKRMCPGYRPNYLPDGAMFRRYPNRQTAACGETTTILDSDMDSFPEDSPGSFNQDLSSVPFYISLISDYEGIDDRLERGSSKLERLLSLNF